MNKKRIIVTGILMLAGFALAQDEGQKARIYGFADIQVVKGFMDDNSVIKEVSSGVSENLKLNFSHLNIYTDFNPNNHLRMLFELGYQQKPVDQQSQVGQIVDIYGKGIDTSKAARAKSPNSMASGFEMAEWGSFSVERAIFQLKLNQNFNFSFGKFITPAGIWNVDHGSPVIMTSRQPTQFSLVPLFPKSQIGLEEDGTFFIGNSDLAYSLYISTGRNQIDIEKPKDLAVGGQLKLNLPLLNEFRIGCSGYTGINRDQLDYMHVVIDSAKVMDLQQQAVMEARTNIIKSSAVPDRISQLIVKETSNPDNFLFTSTDIYKYRENVIGGDFKLKYKRIGFQSEIMYQMVKNMLNDYKETNTLGLYALASLDVIKMENLGITPYLCYERINTEDGENNPSLILAGSIRGYNVFTYGINTKIYGNFGFKVEFNTVDLLTAGSLKDYPDAGDFNALSLQFNIAF